jgi:hypothetical protein
VAMLALAHPGEAKIVYTPADVKITKFHLDLNHDGITDFALVTTQKFVSQTLDRGLSVSPVNRQNQVWGQGKYASALGAGVDIGDDFRPGGKIMAHNVYTLNSASTKFYGQWANGGKGVKNRYLGLKFQIRDKTHFGWARLNVAIGPYGEITATLTGYAYETIPNKSIITGKTKGPDEIDNSIEQPNPSPTPQPATLGLLAMGSHAISIWRRKEWTEST